LYRNILAKIEPDRVLYMAIPSYIYDGIFNEPIGQLMTECEQLQLLVFEDEQERVIVWKP